MSTAHRWISSTPGSRRAATGLLREFNAAGVLSAADVHVAERLGRAEWGERRGGVAGGRPGRTRAPTWPRPRRPERDPRDRHRGARRTGASCALPGPSPEPWVSAWRRQRWWRSGRRRRGGAAAAFGRAAACISTATGRRSAGLRMTCWPCTARVAAVDGRRCDRPGRPSPAGTRRRGPGRGRDGTGAARRRRDADDGQRQAAATALAPPACRSSPADPGTGKTTTVARVVALLLAQAAAAGQRPPLIALAAPTGQGGGAARGGGARGGPPAGGRRRGARAACSRLEAFDPAPAARPPAGQRQPLSPRPPASVCPTTW